MSKYQHFWEFTSTHNLTMGWLYYIRKQQKFYSLPKRYKQIQISPIYFIQIKFIERSNV